MLAIIFRPQYTDPLDFDDWLIIKIGDGIVYTYWCVYLKQPTVNF